MTELTKQFTIVPGVTVVNFLPLCFCCLTLLLLSGCSDNPPSIKLKGHNGAVWSVAFSPDGKKVVTGSWDALRIFDAMTGKELHTLKEDIDDVRYVTFLQDGMEILSVGRDKTLEIWDTETGRPITTTQGFEGPENFSYFDLSPDGKRFVVSDHKTLRVWDWMGGEVKKVEMDPDRRGTNCFALAYSPDGTKIVFGTSSAAHIWDADLEGELQTLEGHRHAVQAVAFSPDSKMVATGSSYIDFTVRIWDAESGKELQKLEGHQDSVCSVAFSPDGKRIVSGSSDGTARIWDVESGKELQVLNNGKTLGPNPRNGGATLSWGAINWVTSVAFSPDGKRVVTGSRSDTARIWALE